MGSRQKREQLQKGLLRRDGHFVAATEVEKAAGEKILRCRVCGEDVHTRDALGHVKECWGMEYASVGVIPLYPPKLVYWYYQAHHGAKEEQHGDAQTGQEG